MKKALIFIFLLVLLLFSCTENSNYIQISGYAQGGTYSVKIDISDVSVSPESISSSIDSILTLVDTTLSGYNKGSQLSRLNRGEMIIPESIFISIYGMCNEIYHLTDSCVDVAAGPLFDAWGFGFKNDSLPTTADVLSIKQSCGMSRLVASMESAISENGLLDPKDMLLHQSDSVLPVLNFNAVAQGYTCDLVADYLHGIGVKNMLVDIGEIFCEGVNPNGDSWSIGVDRPLDGNNSPGEDLDGIWVSDSSPKGIVTSGNYRKYYLKDGKKYSHTIDPRSGFPVEHNLLSATVVAPTCAEADALATYCMVIGLQQSMEFIARRDDIEGYLIYTDANGVMKEWSSDGFTLR